MAISFAPVTSAAWRMGDYRMAASLAKSGHTIEELASRIGASLEHFVEDGLGPAQIFRAISNDGRQIAFDFYELSSGGPNLLVLFELGRCRKSDILTALTFFDVKIEQVIWFAPEMVDA
jgi:hypothetical protein